MKRSPIKAFTAAVFIISLLMLAVCIYNEQNHKNAGCFYCFKASMERMIENI